ncbi:hypothetical protein [Actinokineospora xionganensis]|uniref:Uncharacterized protein n=1 Tax=Actinokineospora xionganensis TaxID=2684470 RepID=A0ABR7L4X1_9PSEU|nr:hypothetical protein [Actinokineospora xionganensis]MBC6447382.1 hypothetical protein [Actinokineospora xionganensis]
MTGPALLLSADDVALAVDDLDLPALLAGELTRHADEVGGVRRVPGGNDADQVAFEDAAGGVFLLPAADLRLVRGAVLVALAARELHVPGVITAAVFGSAAVAGRYLSVIARCVPNLSHVAWHGARTAGQLGQGVLDRLELAGIGVTATDDMRRAAFGAGLLVLAPGADPLRIGPLSPGVLLANATGTDLPDELPAGADQLYVDDLALVDENAHRNFVAMRRERPEAIRHHEGWHRRQSRWRGERRIEADLGAVLAGAHPGRTHVDDVVLVELLGADALGTTLADGIRRVAIENGLGRRLTPTE